MCEASLPSEAVPEIRAKLLDHYDRTARDLPWRRETDPYRIWVSEVMLQQTRVETVLGYYERWLERFPDVDTLARADADEVLKAWEGLGYYRRARNLHRGAGVLRESMGASLPSSYAGLREIPGIGEYTAGAVASIAFGEAVPAVDGNVRRVLSRLLDVERPGVAWLRRTASELVDEARPGDWNQALMELGATVCTPRRPKCGECPLAEWCAARAAGTQFQRPGAARRKDVPSCTLITAVVVDPGGRLLLVRRPEGGLLAGMWAFPEGRPIFDGDGASDGAAPPEEAKAVAGALAVELDAGAPPVALDAVHHRFTHLKATYLPVLLRGEGSLRSPESIWRLPAELREVALPVAQRKIGDLAARALNAD